MISAVRYINSEQTLCEAVIDGKTYQQVDRGGDVGDQIDAWIKQGNKPDPYVAPPPSQEEIRAATFKADTARADMLTKLRTATPAQIDVMVANANTVPKLQGLLGQLIKLIALDARS